MKTLKRRIGGTRFLRTAMLSCLLLSCGLWNTGWSGQIVYPWRATTAIVKAGQTFEVWFNADTGQEVTAVRLESPYKTVVAEMKSTSKTAWVYDKQSGNTCNRKITVVIPAHTPADRYTLVLKTSRGDEKSSGAVKVLTEYKTEYYIMHISDMHAYQNMKVYGQVPQLKISLLADMANIIDPEMVFFTGDHMYFPNDGRVNDYYEGGYKLYGEEMNGLHDFHAATFEAVGNHDYQTEDSPSEAPSRLDKIKHWNQNFGLQAYHFTYEKGRFMVVNDAMGSYQNQIDDAVTWIHGVGEGNFRLGAFHIREAALPFHDALKTNRTPLKLCLAGHEHTQSAGNPWPLNGDPILYLATAIRDFMDFNLFKVDGVTGVCVPVSGPTARVFPLENPPSKTETNLDRYHPKLTLSYAKANDGKFTTNTATITNQLDFGITGARVRFVMKKGNPYTVAAPGVITQQFDGDGDSGRVVDVRVDIGANSTRKVEISVASSSYLVVAKKSTMEDPAWHEVVAALQAKHEASVVSYEISVAEVLGVLKKEFPRYTCFVTPPEEANRAFVAKVHQLTRRLDDDIYTDTRWGILTGYDAANALAIARESKPLTVRKVGSGTQFAMDMVEEGLWYDELVQNKMVRKTKGGNPETLKVEQDTTKALVDTLNEYRPDCFITSGHATEHDWQIGFAYRNGSFVSKEGQMSGSDMQRNKFDVKSENPKVYLAIGNCLMGNIKDRDSMALAWMNSAGVRQMIGYTVTSWFGYAGWGCLDYFIEQPGRYTLAEAFFANHHALIYLLDKTPSKGLTYDRDVVAFYGDPKWEVRMADLPKAWDQSLVEKDGTYTFEIKPKRGEATFKPVDTNGSQRGGRPIIEFLPKRLKNVEIVSGAELNPVITDDFILIPNPITCDSKRAYKVVFKNFDKLGTGER